MAQGQPPGRARRSARAIGWRWRPREQREPEPGNRAATGGGSGGQGGRDRGPARRLYGPGCRRMRGAPAGKAQARYSTLGSLSGGDLAPAGIASRVEGVGDQVGIGRATLDYVRSFRHVCLLISGCAFAAQPPVILISIDTLRADHLSSYGYGKIHTANIDSFAQGGTLYSNVSAQVP